MEDWFVKPVRVNMFFLYGTNSNLFLNNWCWQLIIFHEIKRVNICLNPPEIKKSAVTS